MINFSLVRRAVNTNLIEINQAKARVAQAKKEGLEPNAEDVQLANSELDVKCYAVAQYADVMNIDTLAKHITSHGCVYSRADINAILNLAVDCMREQLLEGKKIRLGDLGDFSVSLISKGVEDASKFNAGLHITGINVNWDCGESFKNLINHADFNLVATRQAQAAVLKAIKAGETMVDLNAKSEDEGQGTGGTQRYSVTVTSGNTSMGSVSGGGTNLAKGTVVTLTATPNSGYKFTQWSDGVSQNPRSIVVDGNKTLTAQFASTGSGGGGFGA